MRPQQRCKSLKLNPFQSALVEPDAPHADDDHGVAGDEQQVDAEEQEVEDVSHVAPVVLQLALLLQRREVSVKLAQVLADLLQLGRSSGHRSRGNWI